MKTMETKEEVSSHPGEKGQWSQKWHRNILSASGRPRLDWGKGWGKGLQICELGEESKKRPTLVVDQKPNGKSQIDGAVSGLNCLCTDQ